MGNFRVEKSVRPVIFSTDISIRPVNFSSKKSICPVIFFIKKSVRPVIFFIKKSTRPVIFFIEKSIRPVILQIISKKVSNIRGISYSLLGIAFPIAWKRFCWGNTYVKMKFLDYQLNTSLWAYG